jgi:predicted ester cyclase
MTPIESKELIRRCGEALNGKPKPAALVSQYISDKSLIAHVEAIEAAFPYYYLVTEELIAEGDLIASRGRMCGVHQGPFMGLPPTGRSIDVPLFVVYRIAGGKIVDHWMVADSAVMLQQLGVAPAPA